MEPPFKNFHVSEETAGLALIAALRRWLEGQSWSAARRFVENRHVQVNGTLCVDEGRRLKAGDVVKLWREPRNPPPSESDLKIRYMDSQIVVVEKPAGMTTTRHSEERDWPQRRRQLQPTLDEMLRQLLAKAAKGRQKGQKTRHHKQPYLRAVHRLDRDTSGLLVFARTAEAERRLTQMFRKHALVRVYQAIVMGRLDAQTFSSRLVRDRGDGLRGSTDLPEVGKQAVTHVRPLEEFGGYTLVECRLETGRTHQIRIHLSEAGHPVCGEKVYRRGRFGPPLEDPSGAQRQALHAAELTFDHPISGERLSFTMPPPEDFGRLLKRLRGEGRGKSIQDSGFRVQESETLRASAPPHDPKSKIPPNPEP